MHSRTTLEKRCSALAALGVLAAVLLPVAAQGGERVYSTADGRSITLEAPRGGATAIVFYSTECPISNAYSPTLNDLRKAFPESTLKLIGACVDPDLTDADFASHAKEYQLSFPVIRDRRARLAARYKVSVTPEAVVIDDAGRVRYRGRIDDQYAARLVKTTNPKTHELKDAVNAVLAGAKVEQPVTKAVGCPIPELIEGASAVTYTKDVAAILQKHCQECHRKGQIGPFPLETYEQARKRASDIAFVVEDRLMPPWKPVRGFGVPFKHDRSMSREEIETLITWAENGAPKGNPDDMPPAPTFPDGWTMGEPDLVVEMPEEFDIPASGGDIYRCFVIPTNLPDDMYISGIQYMPGNPRVVHHILGYVDTSGEARKKDAENDGPGYVCFGGPQIKINNDLGGWAPGVEASRLPDGVGRSLPKGSDVVMQVHYHPYGKPEKDRSKIGLYFAKKPVKQAFHWWLAINQEFVLKPNDPSTWEVKAEWPGMPVDVEALSVAPHMHLLGKDMTVWVEFPDGTRQDLIKIDKWDFQWQNQYYFEKPLNLPKGTKLKLIAHFDYSKDNPRNPFLDEANPPDVGWGEATTDEMCIAFIGLVKKDQDLTKPGQKDDLYDLFEKQVEELRQRRKERADSRRAEGKAEVRVEPARVR